MSDYEGTYTYQIPDHKANRKALMKWRKRFEGKFPLERISTPMPKPKYVTLAVPNPLSMELRIVLGYFWEIYDMCMADVASLGGTEAADDLRQARLDEAHEAIADVRNICFNLFSPASRYSHIHVHSEHGCKDDSCPAWAAGYKCAKENVLDWYTPDR